MRLRNPLSPVFSCAYAAALKQRLAQNVEQSGIRHAKMCVYRRAICRTAMRSALWLAISNRAGAARLRRINAYGVWHRAAAVSDVAAASGDIYQTASGSISTPCGARQRKTALRRFSNASALAAQHGSRCVAQHGARKQMKW